jgi:hypothetical protein
MAEVCTTSGTRGTAPPPVAGRRRAPPSSTGPRGDGSQLPSTSSSARSRHTITRNGAGRAWGAARADRHPMQAHRMAIRRPASRSATGGVARFRGSVCRLPEPRSWRPFRLLLPGVLDPCRPGHRAGVPARRSRGVPAARLHVRLRVHLPPPLPSRCCCAGRPGCGPGSVRGSAGRPPARWSARSLSSPPSFPVPSVSPSTLAELLGRRHGACPRGEQRCTPFMGSGRPPFRAGHRADRQLSPIRRPWRPRSGRAPPASRAPAAGPGPTAPRSGTPRRRRRAR